MKITNQTVKARQAQHTPRPWTKVYLNGRWHIAARQGRLQLATVTALNVPGRSLANARLMVSAPDLSAENKRLRKEVQEWREAVVAIIKSLDQPERSKLCARLATIPSVWEGLSEQDRQQAKMVLACAPEGGQ